MIDYDAITIEDNEHLYGPGRRIVLWTKGCSLRCRGCTSPHLWTRDGAKEMSKEDMIEFCLKQENIEGLTLHGGEPTDQLEALLPVVKALKKHDLSVILFTGREIEDFQTPLEMAFISCCDLIKCGPFELSRMNLYLQFRGSDNQRIIKVSDRYRDYRVHDGQNVVALNISKHGILLKKGFPDLAMNALIDEFAYRKETSDDSKRKTPGNECQTG